MGHNPDGVCAQRIRALLHTRALGRVLTVLCETASTNAELRARECAVHGETVIARRQTAGRGRLGRRFESPEGGLYLSVMLRGYAEPGQVTIRAAAAVHRAVLSVCALRCSIKWVNDLLLDGRKVCGILTEGVCSPQTGRLTGAVCGIGLNVGAVFEPPLDKTAGSLPAGVDKNALAAAVLCELERCLDEPFDAVLRYYRAHCPMAGQDVTVRPSGLPPYEARVEGIDDEGRLVVVRGGQRQALSSGEVSLHRED